MNPFSLLYFVHVTLAAVTLRPVWAWCLVTLSVLGFRLLFLAHRSVGHEASFGFHETDRYYTLHLEGMWISFIIASVFIAYFVLQVSAALQRREAELAMARNLANRNEKLAALVTMAAGAAHELGTPLATIAVVAKELEHTLSNLHLPDEIVEDTRLIRSQVSRCRTILEQLNEGAGQVPGEPLEALPLNVLLKELQNSLGPTNTPRLQIQNTADTQILHVPHRAMMRALTNLLHNALDATDSDYPVSLFIYEENQNVIFCIKDEGPGMSAELVARVGEPFFSTKAPGKGMGLGVFLARNLAEQLGGALVFDSKVGHGTSAILTLPHLPPPSPFSRREA
jgi:two-component system sensor histidine kinase RegB